MELPRPNLKLKVKIVERYGSQSNFAFASNVDETLISKVVRGRRKPTDEQRSVWAALLGCDPGQLFNEKAITCIFATNREYQTPSVSLPIAMYETMAVMLWPHRARTEARVINGLTV